MDAEMAQIDEASAAAEASSIAGIAVVD